MLFPLKMLRFLREIALFFTQILITNSLICEAHLRVISVVRPCLVLTSIDLGPKASHIYMLYIPRNTSIWKWIGGKIVTIFVDLRPNFELK